MALKSAEAADSEKAELRSKILGQKESLEDMRTALKLIVRHATSATRSTFEHLLRSEEIPSGSGSLQNWTTSFLPGCVVWTRQPQHLMTGLKAK
jgi:hypothetical protein